MVDIIPRVQPAQPNVNLPATVARFQQQAIEQEQNPILAFSEGTQVAQRIATNEQIIQSNDIRNETAQVRLEQQKTTAQLVREQKEEDRIFNEKLQSASVNEQLNVLLSTPPKVVQRNQDVANAVAARVETLGSDGAKQAIQQIYKPQYQADLMRKEQERRQKQTFELEQIDKRQAGINARSRSSIESIDGRASAQLTFQREREKRIAKEKREGLAIRERELIRRGEAPVGRAQAADVKKTKNEMIFLLGRGSKGEAAQQRFQEQADRISIAFRNSRGEPTEINGIRMQNEQAAQAALREQFTPLLRPEDQNLIRRSAPASITGGPEGATQLGETTTGQQQQAAVESEIQRRVDQKVAEVRERLRARGTTIRDEATLRNQLRVIVLKELGLE